MFLKTSININRLQVINSKKVVYIQVMKDIKDGRGTNRHFKQLSNAFDVSIFSMVSDHLKQIS